MKIKIKYNSIKPVDNFGLEFGCQDNRNIRACALLSLKNYIVDSFKDKAIAIPDNFNDFEVWVNNINKVIERSKDLYEFIEWMGDVYGVDSAKIIDNPSSPNVDQFAKKVVKKVRHKGLKNKEIRKR